MHNLYFYPDSYGTFMTEDEIHGAYKKYGKYKIGAVGVKLKGIHHMGYLRVDARIILKRISEKWLKMAQYGNEWRDLPSTLRTRKRSNCLLGQLNNYHFFFKNFVSLWSLLS